MCPLKSLWGKCKELALLHLRHEQPRGLHSSPSRIPSKQSLHRVMTPSSRIMETGRLNKEQIIGFETCSTKAVVSNASLRYTAHV